jgi:hypothetical protein
MKELPKGITYLVLYPNVFFLSSIFFIIKLKICLEWKWNYYIAFCLIERISQNLSFRATKHVQYTVLKNKFFQLMQLCSDSI